MKKMLIQSWFVKEVSSNNVVNQIFNVFIYLDHITVVNAYGKARTDEQTVTDLDFYCEIRSLGMQKLHLKNLIMCCFKSVYKIVYWHFMNMACKVEV